MAVRRRLSRKTREDEALMPRSSESSNAARDSEVSAQTPSPAKRLRGSPALPETSETPPKTLTPIFGVEFGLAPAAAVPGTSEHMAKAPLSASQVALPEEAAPRPVADFPIEFGFASNLPAVTPHAAAVPAQAARCSECTLAFVPENAASMSSPVKIPVEFGFAPSTQPIAAPPSIMQAGMPMPDAQTQLFGQVAEAKPADTEQGALSSRSADFPVEFGLAPSVSPASSQSFGVVYTSTPAETLGSSGPSSSCAVVFGSSGSSSATSSGGGNDGQQQQQQQQLQQDSQSPERVIGVRLWQGAASTWNPPGRQEQWQNASGSRQVAAATLAAKPLLHISRQADFDPSFATDAVRSKASAKKPLKASIKQPAFDPVFSKDVVRRQQLPQQPTPKKPTKQVPQQPIPKKADKRSAKPAMAIETLLPAAPQAMMIESLLREGPSLIETLLPAKRAKMGCAASTGCTAGNERICKRTAIHSQASKAQTDRAGSVTDKVKPVRVRWA